MFYILIFLIIAFTKMSQGFLFLNILITNTSLKHVLIYFLEILSIVLKRAFYLDFYYLINWIGRI
jgi:hypothetical protein